MGSIMSIWEPFELQGRAVMSFKMLDRGLGRPKGSAFRQFKRHLPDLSEGADFLRLDGFADHETIEYLKAHGRVYETSVHVVLLTHSGVRKLFEIPRDSRRAPGHGGV